MGLTDQGRKDRRHVSSRIFSDEIGRAMNPRTDWDHWKKLLKAAAVRDGRLHDARHTAATVLLLLGVHERTIMSVLGAAGVSGALWSRRLSTPALLGRS
jgi:integrase